MSVADCPEQIGEAPEIIGVGRGFTVTVMEVSSEQEALPTVTVYVVFPVGEIVIEAVVAPVLLNWSIPRAVAERRAGDG